MLPLLLDAGGATATGEAISPRRRATLKQSLRQSFRRLRKMRMSKSKSKSEQPASASAAAAPSAASAAGVASTPATGGATASAAPGTVYDSYTYD